MAERLDEIEKHIEYTRSRLGTNLQELENKVKHEADWRTHFDRNPMLLVALAFGGGVVLATMTGTPSRPPSPASFEPANGSRSLDGARDGQLAETWGVLKGALIGLAGAKVRGILNEALPGFTEQYEKITSETTARRH